MDATILPDVLTAADVGLWLRLPARSVERMARRGQIPSRTLPTGDIAFDATELAEWLRGLPRGKEATHAP
jgi:hypothetical protein